MKILVRLKLSWQKHPLLWLIFLTGLILRIGLNSAVDSFDFYAFVMWAKYLSLHRIADVFEFLPEGYTPYPPLYYYVLKLIGFWLAFFNIWSNKWLTYLLVRLPVIAADVLVTYFIYKFSQKYRLGKAAIWGAAFYFLHPATIYNTAIWGQIDAIVTLLGLVSVLAFIGKKPFWGIGVYVIGVVTKLQILALLPLILFLSFTSCKFKQLTKFTVFWLLVAALPFLPIVTAKGWKWTWDYFFTIPNWYAYTSVYTYNLWAPFGFIVSDNTKLFGLIAYKWLGIVLFWLVAALILRPLTVARQRRPQLVVFAAFLLWYDFSFFATRIHSRYLIYSFGFFSPFIAQFPDLTFGLSLLMLANLLLPLKFPPLQVVVDFLNQKQTVLLFVLFALILFILSMKRYYQLLKNEKR